MSGILVIARPITAQITGRVTAGGMPLANLWVFAQADFGTNHYEVAVTTDPGGHYAFDVADGTWHVSLNCGDLQGWGYSCPSEATVIISGPSGQVRDFVVNPIPPTPPSLSSPSFSGGQFQFTINGQSGRWYRVWSTADLGNPLGWVDEGSFQGPTVLFSKPLPPGSPHRFYGVEVVP